jgi:hypothetical protein
MATDRYSVKLTDEGWQIFDGVASCFLADAFGSWWNALEERDRLSRGGGDRG